MLLSQHHGMINLIYFNNAATSYPKPPEVIDAVREFLENFGMSPDRGTKNHMRKTIDIISSSRSLLSSLLKHSIPERVIFCKNATEALNLAIRGLLCKGDHCVTTMMDHNSVLRPLYHLLEEGVTFSIAEADKEGRINYESLENLISNKTKLIISPHASNVTGTIADLSRIIEIAEKNDLNLLIDAAQTAGALPFKKFHYDKLIIAFTGHKALLGPQGVGGLILGEAVDIKPLIVGGTGSRSDLVTQPKVMPDFLEAGTPNGVGIAGLNAALKYLKNKSISQIRKHEMQLSEALWEGLTNISGIITFAPSEPEDRTSIVSFISNNRFTPSDFAFILENIFDIATRDGLLCAPLAHQAIGSYPEGVLRLSMGLFNTLEEVEYVVETIEKIMRDR